MKKSTKAITSSIAAIFMLLLSSCAGATDNTVNEQSGPNGHFYVEKVDTDAGEVICIVYEHFQRAGLSCNW